MKISEAFDLYIKNIECKGQHHSAIYRANYIKVRLIAEYRNKSISRLSVDDIQKWLYKMRADHSINTVRRFGIVIRAVLRSCERFGIKCVNYELIPLPKPEKNTRAFLTSEEVTKMIENACNLRSKFVISLLYSSGARLSEIIQLDRDSIKDRQFTVVGKGKKVRLCFIDRRTETYMKRYLKKRKDDDPALIFSEITKKRVSAESVQLLVKNAAERARINKHVTPHVLRHSFATNFLKNNGNIRYLSTMLGHASLNTTAIYTHVMDGDLKRQYRRFHTI